MEKEIDPMIAKFYEIESQEQEQSTETETEIENKEIEKSAEEIEAEKQAEEREFTDEKVKKEAEAKANEEKEKEKVEAKPFVPEFKSEKDRWAYEKILSGEEKEVYNALKQKYEYESYSADQKLIAYLRETNPGLDEADIAFKAESEYGIGLDSYDPELLTDEQKRELKSQEIKRKELLFKADNFFKEKADSYELPTLPNPLDLDEDYKSYKEFQAKQIEREAQIKQEQEQIEELGRQFDATALKIETIEIESKIPLDGGEFSFKSMFTLDENKRKQLAEEAKDRVPTQREIEKYFPEDGKFNIEGYLSHLAKQLFSEQITSAVAKEGIAQAREEFIEKDLKNSTLRNNQTMQQSNREVDPEVAAMRY